MRSILIFFFSLIALSVSGQAQVTLPRSTPEAEGVSSKSIDAFLTAAASSKHEFHSVMILRHGKVIAEGWWNPYNANLKHTLYSCSKSFTATAVGFAVAEKKISVEDQVISFFPDDVPANPSENLKNLRIKHLLSMSVGHDKDPTGATRGSDNWIRSFLEVPVVHQPGTKFVYNSLATYMLSAIVQKVTGQTVLDYLKPRLFAPLNISGMDWETDPDGINTGGWGLRLKTEDMARFGQLFLQRGKWNGKQILPESWVEEASTMKIMQDPGAPQAKKDSSDWLQGYCYQMWRSRHNSYRGDGAYGQFILVLPEQDAVIAITAETPDMQGELNLVWKYILPGFSSGKLAADKTSAKNLKTRLSGLALTPPVSTANATMEQQVNGKTYTMISNDRRLQKITASFTAGNCSLVLQTDSVQHQLNFGAGKWLYNETQKFGPYLVAGARANRVGLPPFKIAGSYSWKDDKTLEFVLRYIESPHHEVITCTFEQDYVTTTFRSSFEKKERTSRGVIQKTVANPPRLIVRGDDMGFSHSGNLALMKSYREGIETSIEVIAPSPWFPEAVKLLQQIPKADVGLHFAITSEWDNIKWRPISNCPSITNEDGYFYPMLFRNRNYPGQAIMDHEWKLEDIEAELRAQIKLARKYIPNLSHISGHMGSTGFDPNVKAMVARVAAEFKLATVDSDPGKSPLTYARVDLAGKTTEQRIDAFVNMVNGLEDGKTYLFVEHPGLNDAELKAISHIGYTDVAEGRQDVTTIFTSEKVREALVRKGVQLVGYRDAIKN
jgi:CubicO group peptidase (beta-lactamase class C family)/predicted glycoside hydrolase/deacetylase ChbG (UPF0249 family)